MSPYEFLDELVSLGHVHELLILVALDGISAIAVLRVHHVLKHSGETDVFLIVEKLKKLFVWLPTTCQITEYLIESLSAGIELARALNQFAY